MKVDADHIRHIIRDRDCTVSTSALVASASRFLDELRWAGTHLDWGQFERTWTFDLDELKRDLPHTFLDTSFFRSGWVLACLVMKEPGLICRTKDFLGMVDEVFWAAPGSRYFFALEKRGETWEPDFRFVGEFDGADRIRIGELQPKS